jgi:hypothetical protein
MVRSLKETRTADLCSVGPDSQSQCRGAMITIPQGEQIPRSDHAPLTDCGFIHPSIWSMIHIIQSGKR